MRAILEIDRGVLELRCHAGVVDMAIALGHSRGLAFAHAQLHARVQRQHVVLAGLDPPQINQLLEFPRMLVGEVVAFREVGLDMVELPLLGI